MSVLASTTKKVLGRVGVGQLTATGCHAANLAAAATLCAEAAAKGCCLLCLPEAFSFIGASASKKYLGKPRKRKCTSLFEMPHSCNYSPWAERRGGTAAI